MTLIELLERIEDKLASRDVGGVDVRASFSNSPRDKLLDVTIEAADELNSPAHRTYYPILRVWVRRDLTVVECDTFNTIDEARWAAIGMGTAAAPIRATAEVPF